MANENTVVVYDDKKKLNIPRDADANRVANQIVAERLRKFLKKHIKEYEDLNKVLLPKELMDLTVAAKNIAEISYKAHEGAPPTLEKPPGHGALGTVAYAVAKGMSDAKKPTNPEELMAQIDQMAKGAGQATMAARNTEKVINIPDDTATDK